MAGLAVDDALEDMILLAADRHASMTRSANLMSMYRPPWLSW